ncbi:MAG TPA: PAS domain S-box protein [Smithellaceae bacterium]|nr:PAS domain S-box protein [Smithellaceae bacterium]HRS82331.1 PAS domain S-box protein [Smithellaceae bacterium]
MKDHAKTKQTLIGELASLRERIAKLERSALEQKQAEEELRESAEKYRLLFEYSPLGHFYFDEKGIIVACNDHFVDIIGSSRKVLIGLKLFGLRDQKIVDAVQKALDGKTVVYEDVYQSVTADKATPVRAIFTPIHLEGKGVIGGLAIIEDITERRRAEAALRESEEHYRSLVENADEAILVIQDGRIKFVNARAVEAFGYSVREFMSIPVFELVHPEDREIVIQRYLEKINGDAAPTRHTYRALHKEGLVAWIEISSILINWEGRPATLNLITDITDRKKAEDALREREEKYRTILESIEDGYFEQDLAGNFVFVNDSMSRIYGYSKEELIGLNYKQYTDLESGRKCYQIYLNIYKTGKPGKVVDFDIIRKDGTRRHVESSVSLIRDNAGTPVAFRGIVRDVTERKQAEEALAQSFARLRDALSATVQATAMIVETRDPYTAGHQRRVADLGRAIAVEMKLTDEQIEGVHMAGMVHDLGKISVPSEILSKPTRLTDLESRLIKTHSQSGYDILKDIEFPWPIARIVLEHHERMNGSGYPNGLKGDQSLPESRILSVADAVEAMASHRPYRPGLGIDAALAEIEANRGVLYDPLVVDACLKLFREKGYRLPES